MVELRNAFGGGVFVFRYHMGLLAPGGEFKVNVSWKWRVHVTRIKVTFRYGGTPVGYP
jgi:hypothetical protein